MHVVKTIARRGDREYVSHLVRTSYREDGKVKKRTLANLSHLPQSTIEVIRADLAGQRLVPADARVELGRSTPHGHVAAVLGKLHQLGLEALLHSTRSRERQLVLGMIVLRVLAPGSKLAATRRWGQTTLGAALGASPEAVEDLYAALDWLQGQQARLERALAKRHLTSGALVLYDVTSVYLEGDKCPLAARGYSRDQRKDRPQIVVGVMCDGEGRPVAVEVFPGNTADPATLAPQVDKLRKRFRLDRVILVGDRGMLTEARLSDLKSTWKELDWVTCLRAPAIQELCRESVLQPSLFDERSCVELTSAAHPGERLIACRNPFLAAERTRKREALLGRTEADLAPIAAAVAAGRLVQASAIGLRVGKVLHRYKMGKHFVIRIEPGQFTYERAPAAIAAEQQLDGIYVVRTSVPAEQLAAADVVRTYKLLSRAERFFRCLKRTDLQVRPVFHRLEDRVRAHVFLCMLAAYVQWHLERDWAPLLYREEDPTLSEDPVAPPERSPSTRRKECEHQSAEGLPIHNFKTLLAELATLSRVEMRIGPDTAPISIARISQPTELQRRAFELIGVDPVKFL